MQDHKNAAKMLSAADKDFKALLNMQDEALFEVEIFGFHAQQTVEKLLKAWLSKIGVRYQKIHDLQILFSLLKDNNQNIPLDLEELEELTDFAITFRYEVFDNIDAYLNRSDIINKIKQLINIVRELISGS